MDIFESVKNLTANEKFKEVKQKCASPLDGKIDYSDRQNQEPDGHLPPLQKEDDYSEGIIIGATFFTKNKQIIQLLKCIMVAKGLVIVVETCQLCA